MKSFDASAGSPTKKYVVMVALKALAAEAAGSWDAGSAGVEDATGVVVAAGGRKSCGVGVLAPHAAAPTPSATSAESARMMDIGFMVRHSTSLGMILQTA